jgi:hypothetical protein
MICGFVATSISVFGVYCVPCSVQLTHHTAFSKACVVILGRDKNYSVTWILII